MKLLLVVFVVSSVMQVIHAMVMCQGWGRTCSLFDSQSNCCNGFTCRHWSLKKGICIKNKDNCVRRGKECGLFKYCCGELDCQKNLLGKYVCRRDRS